MLQQGAAGSQLLDVRVADSAVGCEEELSKLWQAAGELLETTRAALQCGAPAQVEFLQRPEQSAREISFRLTRRRRLWSTAATLTHCKYIYKHV